MGSKVSIQNKRLKKHEFEQLCASINREEFLNFYLNNGNEAVCVKYNIGLTPMYRLLKFFNITLTPSQLKYRNKIASSQRVQSLYGVENNFQRKEVQEKIKENLFITYGVVNQFQLDSVKRKSKETCQVKYGADTFSQSKEFRLNSQTKFIYEGIHFDSLPELAVWIYAKDHGIKIVREPIKLMYVFEGKKHYYFPDFLYDGRLIEIKGLHFFVNKNKDLAMINPFDPSRNAITEEKHQCGLRNNVEFWVENDYKFAVDYLNENYTLDVVAILTKNSKVVNLNRVGVE